MRRAPPAIYTLSLHDALPISENRHLARIARRTVLSESALSVLVPVLDQLLGLRAPEIRVLFESYGVTLHEWERSEEHTSELQSHHDLVCRLLLEKKNNTSLTC